MQSVSILYRALGGLDKGNARKLDNYRAFLVIIGVMKGFLDLDARLLQAILAGDAAAWQKFILKYSNFIYRAVIQYTDDYAVGAEKAARRLVFSLSEKKSRRARIFVSASSPN